MIKSIQKIKGVGRYKDYYSSKVPNEQQIGHFQKFNLIYGENGSGKTTLAHIFRSLKGSDDLLLKKKSFDYLDSPEVEIKVSGLAETELIYSNFKWQKHNANIEIFDTYFINTHIYTGLEIQNDHKKKLFEIILGDAGVILKNQIQTIKERIRNGNKIVRENSKALEAVIDNAYTALEYANLSADSEIDAKILWKEKELDTAKNHEFIQAKAELTLLPTIQIPLDFATAKKVLAQSLDFISKDYLEKMKSHKGHLKMGDKTEEWLQQGFTAQYDDKCPFCLQKMDDSMEILQAYQQYFNATYKQLLADIKTINTSLANFNLEAILLQIENILTVNWGLIDFWKKYLAKAPTLLSIAEEKAALLAAFEQIKTLFQTKLSNPIQALESTELEKFETIFVDLSEKMAGMNVLIGNYNQSIEAMKAHNGTNTLLLETELQKLLALKKRSEPSIEEQCNTLLKYTAAIERLRLQNDSKKEELNQFKGIVFNTYLSVINRHLKNFAPYLSLRKLTSGYLGSSTEPVVKFALCVNGKEVVHKEKAERPSMKYSLSEGDKNALALAFFLSKLESDENLSDKIIIFDDTVSSFDHHRQAKLLDQLIAFGQKGKQLFFLTHDLPLNQAFEKRIKAANLSMTSNQLAFFNGTMNLVKL